MTADPEVPQVSVYERLVGELLIDPAAVCRELDEWLIRWWALQDRRSA